MTKTIIPFIFLFLLIFNCKSQSIGDYYQGGVVFYLDSFGGGLIVDIVDIPNPNPMVNTSLDSMLSRWGNYSTHVPGTSSPSIGSGIINTQNFITFYIQGILLFINVLIPIIKDSTTGIYLQKMN